MRETKRQTEPFLNPLGRQAVEMDMSWKPWASMMNILIGSRYGYMRIYFKYMHLIFYLENNQVICWWASQHHEDHPLPRFNQTCSLYPIGRIYYINCLVQFWPSTQLKRVAPVLTEYRNQWPVYAILKQYLGTHSRTLAKDLAAEKEEEGCPDRDAIKAYYKTLGSSQVGDRVGGRQIEEFEDETSEENESEQEPARRRQVFVSIASAALSVILKYPAGETRS